MIGIMFIFGKGLRPKDFAKITNPGIETYGRRRNFFQRFWPSGFINDLVILMSVIIMPVTNKLLVYKINIKYKVLYSFTIILKESNKTSFAFTQTSL